jgi:hypothetical protein
MVTISNAIGVPGQAQDKLGIKKKQQGIKWRVKEQG